MPSQASADAVPLVIVSTEEATIRALRERILDGSEKPGSPLREAELSRRFRVSRHSLRTAMRTLAHEGLLRHEPNRGMFVRELTADDVRDIYFVRRALETEVARELAATPSAAEPAAQALQALADLPPDVDWRVIRDCDLAFHSAFVRSSNRARPSAIFDSVLSELRLAFGRLQGELSDRDEIYRQHAEILRAVQAGDPDQAATIVAAHLDQAVENLCASFEATPSLR